MNGLVEGDPHVCAQNDAVGAEATGSMLRTILGKRLKLESNSAIALRRKRTVCLLPPPPRCGPKRRDSLQREVVAAIFGLACLAARP